MKRIGILTYHRSYNYGAYMQCYSLSKRIQELFPEYKVEVIDYLCKSVDIAYKKAYFYSIKNHWTEAYKNIVFRKKFKQSLSILPLSDKYILSDDLNEVFEYMKGRYDAIIVGSDAVWNWGARPFPNAYMLNESFGCPTFSYAASCHGQNYLQMSQSQKKYLGEAFARLMFIGVRDTTTEEMVRYVNPSLQPIHTCDPTILLDMKDSKLNFDMHRFKERLVQKYNIKFDKPIICTMLRKDVLGKAILQRYGKSHTIISLAKYNKYADAHIYDLTPFEWSKVFSLCQITFAQYFHGAIFSLKNSVPTITMDVFKTSQQYVGKIEDIYNRLGLSDWFFNNAHGDNDFEKMFMKADQLLGTKDFRFIEDALRKEANEGEHFFDALRTLID